MDEVNESEINEIKSFESEETSKEDDVLDNESYDILNESSSCDEKEEENDAMQVDEERLNKKIIEGLRLLHLKSVYNFIEAAYNDIIKLFANKNLSLYKVKKILEEFTGLVPTFYKCVKILVYVIQTLTKITKVAHYASHQDMIQITNRKRSCSIFLLKRN